MSSIGNEDDQQKTFNLGERYQEKVIANLIHDEPFTDSVIDIIHEDYFDHQKYRWIITKIKEHYEKYYEVPSYESFLIDLKKDFPEGDKSLEEQKNAILVFLHKVFKKKVHILSLLKEQEKIQDECRFFCKKKEFANAIFDASNFVKSENLEEAQERMEKAFLTGRIKNDGVDFDDVEDRINSEVRDEIIPLPWESVNKRIGGGIGKGECMVVVAPMGAGKTTLGCNIGVGTRRRNFTFVLYSLELDKKYVRHKTDSIMLQMTPDNLLALKKENPKEYGLLIQKGLDQMPEGANLIIQRFPSGITATDINQDLKILKTKGYTIDGIIIDYLDLMETVEREHRSKKDWEKYEYITRDCRDKIAFENKIAVIGFMQGNTNSINEPIITAQNTSGGAKRLHPADIIFGYARTSKDKNDNRASWSFIKNRFGEDGFYLPVITDYSIGMVEVHDNQIPIGDQEEQTEEEVRSKIADRFKKHRKEQKKHDPDVLEDYISKED